jgi:hypothetical protein
MGLQINIEGTHTLPENAPAILQTLFPQHRRIIIKREFTGNFSGSRVFLVQPITERGADHPVVVKFAALSLIEKEWRAYRQVQQMLYGMVQVREKILPSDGEWGALCYPMQGGGVFEVRSLENIIETTLRTRSARHSKESSKPSRVYTTKAMLPQDSCGGPAMIACCL